MLWLKLSGKENLGFRCENGSQPWVSAGCVWKDPKGGHCRPLVQVKKLRPSHSQLAPRLLSQVVTQPSGHPPRGFPREPRLLLGLVSCLFSGGIHFRGPWLWGRLGLQYPDGEDALGGGGSAGHSLENTVRSSYSSGRPVAATYTLCVCPPRKRGDAARAARALWPAGPVSAEGPSLRGLWGWCWALPGAGRVGAREPPGEMRARVKGHTQTPRDGNDKVLLSLCCFPCTLVKTWGQSVCDGPNKCLLIRPGRFCQHKKHA